MYNWRLNADIQFLILWQREEEQDSIFTNQEEFAIPHSFNKSMPWKEMAFLWENTTLKKKIKS